MHVLLITKKASGRVLTHMLEALETYIKVAVDIQNGVLVGGGIVHADCGKLLQDCGSQKENIWGADYEPASKTLTFDASINVRPEAGNNKITIESSEVRSQVEKIVRELLEP